MKKKMASLGMILLLVSSLLGCAAETNSSGNETEKEQPSSQETDKESTSKNETNSEEQDKVDNRISEEDPTIRQYNIDTSPYFDAMNNVMDGISAYEKGNKTNEDAADIAVKLVVLEKVTEKLHQVTPPPELVKAHEALLQVSKEMDFIIKNYPQAADTNDPMLRAQIIKSSDYIEEYLTQVSNEYDKAVKPVN